LFASFKICEYANNQTNKQTNKQNKKAYTLNEITDIDKKTKNRTEQNRSEQICY